jgi:hypothetical protein
MDIFCKTSKLLKAYDLPLNKLLCTVTDGAPAMTRVKRPCGKINENL